MSEPDVPGLQGELDPFGLQARGEDDCRSETKMPRHVYKIHAQSVTLQTRDLSVTPSPPSDADWLAMVSRRDMSLLEVLIPTFVSPLA